MLLLTPDQTAALRGWFRPDRPGPQVGLHVIQTGNGVCVADRWPDPRAAVVETAGNYTLAGDPAALGPDDLRYQIAGFVEAPGSWRPLLRATFPDLRLWDRVILELPGAPQPQPARGGQPRRLGPGDAELLRGLRQEVAWVAKTWGGPVGLAESGYAWGSFAEGRLVSLACPFFVGARYEDIGVATAPEARGQGHSAACVAALCADILARGRRPSWTTSPDNAASLRVAEKVGFTPQRRDHLYIVGIAIPT